MTVFLVGAGPGDPGLVTVRGLELIRGCDALVYDVLVAPELVEEAPADALVIPREKRPPGRAERAARRARPVGPRGRPAEGRRPVHLRPRRRGGRSARRGRDRRIEVVPGVSALSAVPASAGIPVTHRGVSAQVTLVSGHSASGEELDYAQLAGTPGTLVIFMGLAHLSGDRRAA